MENVKMNRGMFACALACATLAFSLPAANLLPPMEEVHLVDDDAGQSNSLQSIPLPRKTVDALRGKVVYFAGRVRQDRASDPTEVGFSLGVHRSGGRSGPHVKIGTGSHGRTPWLDLRLALEVPSDADGLKVDLNCAVGWGNTGEASFRDLVLSDDPADLPKPEATPPEAFEENAFTEIVPTNDTPAMAELRRSYREQPPTEEDGKARPEIRNGTWYMAGRPVFFVGPWIGNRIDYGNPLKIDHVTYRKPGSPEAFDFAGFNSAQISAAHAFYGAILRGLPIDAGRRHWEPDFAARERTNAGYYADFADRPIVIDFAFGFVRSLPAEIRRRADQVKLGTCWHEFIPLCPEGPEGRRYYRDYFLGGTRAALRHGANPYLYELFNESAYACGCVCNRVDFARRMKARYGSIERANAVWGTHFRSYWEVSIQTGLAQYGGLRYDWYSFLADRYCEILKSGIADIRSVDRRSRVYFTEQAAGNPAIHRGEDVCKLADTLDALAIEGGWGYGGGKEYEAKDGMDAVIAGASTKHFFNCDFNLAAVRAAKPVVNNEHYCGRFEDGLRVPSRREDYITSLWLETMHGVSATYFYNWDKRSWDYRDAAGAKSNVVHQSYKSYSFLNPFNCAPENLDAFGRFRRELEPYRDRLLPFPRVLPATVAVFASRTREIHRDAFPPHDPKLPGWQVGRHTRTSDWYLTLLHAFYPVKVVFARDLAELGPEVKVVVVPEAEAEKASVAADLARFAARGGTVLAEKGAFAFDEHMKPSTAETGAFVRVADPKALLAAMARLDVPRYANLEPLDGRGPVKGADVQVCDRGDFKLVCLAAMSERTVRKVRLTLVNLTGTGPWRVRNGVTGAALRPSAPSLTAADLAAGFEFDLPPQERVILVLEK